MMSMISDQSAGSRNLSKDSEVEMARIREIGSVYAAFRNGK
jgi:hypothetical protein